MERVSVTPILFNKFNKGFVYVSMYLIMLFTLTLSSCNVLECQSCESGNNNVCAQCLIGFYGAGGKCCFGTVVGCTACTSDANLCDSCAVGYYPSSPICIQCNLPLCSQCSSSTVCTKCVDDTYAINSISNQCQPCWQLMNNCSNCASAASCTKCSPNTFVVSITTSQCVLCNTYLDDCQNCDTTTACLACFPNPKIALDPITQTCIRCQKLMPSCVTCISSTICLTCTDLYVVSPGVNCVLCASLMHGCLKCNSLYGCLGCSFGFVVKGGCSKVAGCIQVVQVASPKASPCIRCNSQQFYPIPVNGTCKCLQGILAGTHCTTIVGCTNIVRNSSGDTCLTCSLVQNFILSEGICACQQGYYLNGLICSQICGDGLLFKLQCDDGNTVDGDGCSSTCQIEMNYKCNDGSKTTPSNCIYIGFVSMTVTSIDKVDDENQILITITTSPKINNLQLMDVTDRYSFGSSGDCNLLSATLVGPSIQLLVQYNQNLIGVSANFSMNFDQNIIQSYPIINYSFPIVDSSGNWFQFDPYIQSTLQKMISSVAIVLSIPALIIFFIGSYAHKMIGVQTIHSFQLTFIMQAFSSKYHPLMSGMQYLSLTIGISNFKISPKDYITQDYYNNLTFRQDIIYNIYLLLIIQLSIVSFYIFVFIAHKMTKNKIYETDSCNHKYQTFILKLRVIYYQFLLFPIFIGFFFLTFLSVGTFCRRDMIKHYSSMHIQAIAALFIFLFTNLAFFNQWKFLFFQNQQNKQNKIKCKQLYVPIYLTYLLVLSFALELELFQMIDQPIYVCGGIIVIYSLITILYRPYKQWVHNVGIIINQIGVLICLIWLLLQKAVPNFKFDQPIIAYCQIAWFSIILMWAIVRIIYEFRLSVLQLLKTKEKKSKKIVKKYEQYCNELRQQILSNGNGVINPIMAQRLRSEEVNYKDINKNQKQSGFQESNLSNNYKRITSMLTKPIGYRNSKNEESQHSNDIKNQTIIQLQERLKKTVNIINLKGSTFK